MWHESERRWVSGVTLKSGALKIQNIPIIIVHLLERNISSEEEAKWLPKKSVINQDAAKKHHKLPRNW